MKPAKKSPKNYEILCDKLDQDVIL